MRRTQATHATCTNEMCELLHRNAQVVERVEVPFHEVDAHNVVPVWVASGKAVCHVSWRSWVFLAVVWGRGMCWHVLGGGMGEGGSRQGSGWG